jgi:hypothetical protein
VKLFNAYVQDMYVSIKHLMMVVLGGEDKEIQVID